MIKEYNVAGDPSWTLQEWHEFVHKMINTYGKNAKMLTDAGYNNVSLVVHKIEEPECFKIDLPKKQNEIQS